MPDLISGSMHAENNPYPPIDSLLAELDGKLPLGATLPESPIYMLADCINTSPVMRSTILITFHIEGIHLELYYATIGAKPPSLYIPIMWPHKWIEVNLRMDISYPGLLDALMDARCGPDRMMFTSTDVLIEHIELFVEVLSKHLYPPGTAIKGDD